MILAEAILAAHLAIILFNLFGLIAVPLGAVWRWQFVRVRWWRLLHLVSLAAVAAQAVFGHACILTIWQAALTGATGRSPPLIMGWVNRVIYWPLPLWIFAAFYLLVFGYALALLWLVPPAAPHPGSLPASGASGARELGPASPSSGQIRKL
jgi:Protein of Unknown function (DUF2784)